MKSKRKARCVIMACRNHALARGLCKSHYWKTVHKIKKGETTWRDEEAKGAARVLRITKADKLAEMPTAGLRKAVEKTTQAVHSHKTGKLCIVPGCSDEAATRGLCTKDYAVANSLVKKGLTTWKKLVGAGRAEASHKEIPRVQRAKDFFLGK